MAALESRRVRILVKAFPQASRKYEETVCCAGVSEGDGAMLRLFPIRFRRLDEASRFDRYDLVSMTVEKASSDQRPESYRVHEESIRRVAHGRELSGTERVRLWIPHIASSVSDLYDEQASNGRSMGIVRPDSVRFRYRRVGTSTDAEALLDEELTQTQFSMLEEELTPLEKPAFSFSYEVGSGGRIHNFSIQDWEVQETFRSYRKHYGSEAEALKQMEHQFQEVIPSQNLHLVLGTIKSRPRQFILIGLLRSPIDPAELSRQQRLL